MKHPLVITAPGHPGTVERMDKLFDATKLWEAPDNSVVLQQLAPRMRALAHAGHSKLGAELMDALPKLEIIAHFGVGVDQIDLEAARQRGIIVTNTPEVLDDCVADCAMALVLNTLRKFPQAEAYLRAGHWKTRGSYPLTTSVGGKTLGILGLGRIGSAIARRALAFGMNIRYHNRNPKDLPYPYDPDPIALAQHSDVLLIATPGGENTERLVGAGVLEALGPRGYLVNIARGSVVDQPVLLHYLQAQKIAGAGLDVYDDEPNVPPAFFALDNAVLLPHVGSASEETRRAMGDLQIENLLLHLSGEAVKTRVV